MDKNAIKKYAVWARRELIERVSQKALQYGITADSKADLNADSVNGRLLTGTEKKQRQTLMRKVNERGYEQVMEEVAYTWFNRFAALRFMEVNGYLPSHVRVFTNDFGEFRPQILSEAIHLDLDGLDMEKVYELKGADREEELFKYLLIVQCNALNKILPKMFQRLSDHTELLFPDNLLRKEDKESGVKGSILYHMVTDIPEEDWLDQVQIIGWLYQYYNIEPKDKVFADLKKNIKITKENIPAATQLFTPDWIVRYMVENSLGRLWLEGHPNDTLKSQWKYYLDEAEQEAEVRAQLDEICREYAALKPEDIKCIDPCMGSGHILCYLFDVLVQIYEDYGHTAREAVGSIVEKNLWGLDIDDRAAQLAYFAVMMKARQYDRRFFVHPVQPNVYAIQESNWIDGAFPFDMGGFLLSKEHQETLDYLIDSFHDAKEYGSILQLEQRDYAGFIEAWELTASQTADKIDLLLWYDAIKDAIPELAKPAIALTQQYQVICTNPPYMTVSNASSKLQAYVKKNFPGSKSDLFAVYIERCGQLAGKNGYQAMITQHAWMFLSSFEKLRVRLQAVDTVNMVHLGARAFEEINGEVVQTTSFVMRRSRVKGYQGTYCRLVEPTTQQGKEDMFLSGENRYAAQQDNFSKIPGLPVAYWVSEKMLYAFVKGANLSNVSNPRQGLITGDVDRFVRKWFECSIFALNFHGKNGAISRPGKWFPYCNGGNFRKWFGNNEDIVNWENDGLEIKQFVDDNGKQRSRPQNQQFYFRAGGTWSAISSGYFSVRFFPEGFIFSNAGMAIYADFNKLKHLIGFLNSKIAQLYLKIFNEGLNYNQGDIAKLPVIFEKNDEVSAIFDKLIIISKTDWDSFETSWDFARHPLVRSVSTVAEEYGLWEAECNNRFHQLKANEEELNRIFIDIYGLQDELTPEVEDKDVTVRKADLGRDIRSLISYAVGCMFGRYSLHKEGLVFAGGKMEDVYHFHSGKLDGTWTLDGTWAMDGRAGYYLEGDTYLVSPDNILPICDDDYFEDDIMGRFVEWVETVYGKATLEENLKFIADALGGKGSPREVIRKYFLNDFYADHCKIYQKRPIYWLFDSGKKNGFKCLIYLHRYQPDTIARIRTDYVHEQQARYRTAIADLEQHVGGASASERVKLSKRLAALQAQAAEIREYEEKIHHLADQMIKIDLDDGVKKNYAIFQDVLAKIK